MKATSALITRWLILDLRAIWLCFSMLGFSLLSIWLFGATEQAIRITGLLLQLAGIVTVAWGILATRSLFGLPSARHVVRVWWKRRPFRKVNHASAYLSGGWSAAADEVEGYASHPIDPATPIPEALRIIQQNVELVYQRVTELHAESITRHQALQKCVYEKTDRIEKGQEELSLHVKRFGTGSLHISAIGAVWLFVGAILGATSPELNMLLR